MSRRRARKTEPNAVRLLAMYEAVDAGWSASLVREGVVVEHVCAEAELQLHDVFHRVLQVLEERTVRLDRSQETMHMLIGQEGPDPEGFALLAARGGWLQCRDSVCTSAPVPDLTVDPERTALMVTFTMPPPPGR